MPQISAKHKIVETLIENCAQEVILHQAVRLPELQTQCILKSVTMPSIKISGDTLNKLTHETLEIRLRTLEQLSSKLYRALTLNETIEFKSGDLCKQLIRWFGFLPPQQSSKVLNLLKSIIESPKYGYKAIEKLGSERLIKELRKIESLFNKHSAEFNIICEIKGFLKNVPLSKANTEFSEKSPDFEELIQCASNMNIEVQKNEYNHEDYEMPWSQPSLSDYTSMKFVSDILKNKFATSAEIENAVSHLQLTMIDYPAEYLLQTPHVFQNLLQHFDERKSYENRNISINVVASALLQILFNLEKRIEMMRKSITFKQDKRSSHKNSQPAYQLKIERALTQLLDASIFHLESYVSRGSFYPVIWEMIYMVLKLMANIKPSVDICLHKVESIVSNLTLKFAESEHFARWRVQQMLLIFLLQDVAIMKVSPNSVKPLEVFEPILRDYTMKYFFAKRHQIVEEFVFKTDKALKEKYQLLKLYERAFETSVRMLTNKSIMSCGDIIKEGHIICIALDMLQSKELIDVLFGGIIQGIPIYPANNQMKMQAIALLLKLLNLSFMPLKIYIYEKLTDAFKRHIGCLMIGERYALECSNEDLLKKHIVGVPLNTEILTQLVHDAYESSSHQIKSSCCKIFELFLQSQTLFGSHWFSLLPIVVPVLPLLSCCTLSEKIMNLLLKIFDPDLMHLPFVAVLQGNLGFLFQTNADRRSESLTRLVYTMQSLKSAENYVPNVLEISDTIPNDICLQSAPREYRNIFNDRLPASDEVITSLNNLLHLLESLDVEPLIRKTTLMQINLLCSSWRVTAELCSVGGYYLILQALENALQKSSRVDYADTAGPAICILNKVILYDASVRCELAETPNIYVLLLRALIMFYHDVQVCQDATMCLFQLLFSSQLISTENCIEGPLILGNIKIPVDINLRSTLHNKINKNSEKLSQVFTTASEETQYWRMVVASCYCGGLKNITRKSIDNVSQLKFKDDLRLTAQDVKLIRATQPGVSLHRVLRAASNATDHRSLIQACQLLKQQLIVATLKETFSISDEFCVEINNILRKLLQMPPGNDSDLDLYEHLLDVAIICLKIPLRLVALEIFKCLHKDSHHALVAMLTQAEEIPIRIYNKIATLLRFLIADHKHVYEIHFNNSECCSIFSNLFDLYIERCFQLFEIRDLLRVRCLISLLVVICSCQLSMGDQLLLFYCRRFIQLSLGLKSFTQTGAQWHRDCLSAILQLCNQMQNPYEHFRLTANFIKYLSGLCAHNDMEVRTLAWSILNITAKTNAIDRTDADRKSSDISGVEMLINELAYLPGGFMACCLITLLDVEEAICVRHLAGQLLAVLIRRHVQVKAIEKLVEQHNFTRLAAEALCLSLCIFEVELPKEMDASTINITSCELISSYSLICIELSQRSSAFLHELCTRSFMFKLYEVLKQPPPLSNHIGYLNMIGHICHLYALCYSDNLVFLQRTICRDVVWLRSFCKILFEIVPQSKEIYFTFNVLQLFLILVKDSNTLEQLSIIMRDYAIGIVNLFQNTFHVKNLNTSLQSCSLSVLSLLLIKSQAEVDKDLNTHILGLFESQNVPIKSIRCNEIFGSDDKENNNSNKTEKNKFEKDNGSADKIETNKSSISEHLCISLMQLFTHLYPVKVCTFSTAPNENQQHVTETLALLLKQSIVAQETAQNLKFQNKVLHIFKYFFDDFATTTYIKRSAKNQKMAVLKNLQLLLKLWLSWHSSRTMIITDALLAVDYNKIIIKIWPWLAHSNVLKLTVLQVCSFLSESSLEVCKQFSTLNNGSFSHSVLQLVAKVMISETLKIKANSTDCSTFICFGLRILMNCCSCLEGRTALNKIHILNVFDSLYPFSPKASQLKLDIVIAWLEFWELFSRYDEGAQSHHLNALCSVINKSPPGCSKRLMSLRILRNMAFLNINRSALITSTDFTFTINEIVVQPIKQSVEEQFIVCVALWKLISGGIKFVAMIRGTKLAKNLRLLKDNLTCTNDENYETKKFSKDLINVLNIIFKIFNNQQEYSN